ncbi:MAG: trigger factor [Desulfobacterales bacterium]|nr:trigger factor [Desulfobacterales bacterium]
MQFNVEHVSTVKKVLHIEIPKEDVVKELDRAYGEIKKTAKIKGFRSGKAPRSVIEKIYKNDVTADVANKLIQTSIIEALKETNFKFIGQPRINPPLLDENAPYKFDATIEINPEIANIDFKGLSLKKSKYEVKDEEIDVQIKMLQKNLAKYILVEEDRELRDGDYAIIDYEGFKDGTPYEETQNTKNFTLKIGDGSISKEFDSSLIGLKRGEKKEMNIHFPEDHTNKKLANLDINFHVTLKEIRAEELPEINDNLAKSLGKYETLEDLKKAITDNLTLGYAKRVEQEQKEQIFEALLKKTEFEVPDLLIEYELSSIMAEVEQVSQTNNIPIEKMFPDMEKFKTQYRPLAEAKARRFLILDKLIEQEKIELSDEEIDKGMNDMAKLIGTPIDEIKKYYKTNESSLEYFKHTLLEKKALDLIISQSATEEI